MRTKTPVLLNQKMKMQKFAHVLYLYKLVLIDNLRVVKCVIYPLVIRT